jgi:hypothetical protein
LSELLSTRRELLALPLLAAAFATLAEQGAHAAGVDPTMTIITPPDKIPWQKNSLFPIEAAETAPLFGKPSDPGPYFMLIRWKPGFMSAPHWYETDRLCIVLSGTWWCASGEDFAPEATVPVLPGSFVRRVARTPHYDGAKKTDKESAVIAISGIGPINFHLSDPSKPGWREV